MTDLLEKYMQPTYDFIQGDCIPTMHRLAAEARKFDISVFSPPFASLFAYSDHEADMGNSKDSDSEFLLHYEFFAKALFPIMQDGSFVCVHLQQVQRTKGGHGHMGLFDIRGYVNRIMDDAGFLLYGEVAIPKNPQAQSISKKVHQLQFSQWQKDSRVSRPALADWLQIYKMPGQHPAKVRPIENNGMSNDVWIKWADMNWVSRFEQICYPQSVWLGINETHCLNNAASVERVIGRHHKPANTKFDGDERHMCPLQLDLIERCVLLWSNPGETLFTPFGGIGSEPLVALQHDRHAVAVELNPAYVDEGRRNCDGILARKREEKKQLFFNFD